MEFGGIQKTSLLDFPDNIATILFTPRCNLRCPFCHNWRLVIDPKGPFLSEDSVLRILKSRKQFVNAVVITGGEPTMQNDIPNFLRILKENNFLVKIDTNGFFPDILKKCLPFLNYVALDIKTCPKQYQLLGSNEINNLFKSIEILKSCKIDYEFRNTVVPGLIDDDCVSKIGELVKGAKRFVFQQFVPGDTLDKAYNFVKPYSFETITHFEAIMKQYVNETKLRF